MKPFYDMTRAEAIGHLRSLYNAQPKADWTKLAVGNVIMQHGRAWRITHIPPERGFVTATNVMTGEDEKLLRSKYANSDLLLTDEKILARLQTDHAVEIGKAMAAGIIISPRVQYDYPEIFTTFPSDWDERRRRNAHDLWLRINDMRAFRDHADGPGWQFQRVAEMLAQIEEDIASWKSDRAKLEAGVDIKKPEAIPGLLQSVDATLSDLREQIENLGHLRKHLENTLPAHF